MSQNVRRLGCLTAVVMCAPVATASAAERYVSPSGSASSPCTQAAPCKLKSGVENATANDNVVVLPGTYNVSDELQPNVALTIRGLAGQPKPRLVGRSSLEDDPVIDLHFGGALRNLVIESASDEAGAVVLDSGVADNLVVSAVDQHALAVYGSPGQTVVRDSVVRSTATGTGESAIRVYDGTGDSALVNVTAVATSGQAVGVRCGTSTHQTVIANSIVRGAAKDIDASTPQGRCAVSSSNFRPLLSPGVIAGSGNSAGDPMFTNAAAGDFRPQAGSPAIDAGAAHALLGTTDVDGRQRTLGSAPDQGAHEAVPAEAPPVPGPSDPPPAPPTGGSEPGPAPTPDGPAPQPAPEPEPEPAPELGREVVVAPTRGVVRFRAPGTNSFVTLDENSEGIPVGSVIDTTRGAVTLSTALPDRKVQTGTFGSGKFRVAQDRKGKGMVDIVLTGGDFSDCAAPAQGSGRVLASASGRRKSVRSLWGSDRGGRFRTHGRKSVATVRGTRWFTQDRCGGTFTKVVSGAVDVRVKRTGTVKRLRAGQSLLVR